MNCRLLFFFAFSISISISLVPSSACDESQMRINLRVHTGPDDVITFSGTLLVSLRDENNGTDVYLRFATGAGNSADSLQMAGKSETLTFQRANLFVKSSQTACLRFFLYSPGYLPGEDITFVNDDETAPAARIVLTPIDRARLYAQANPSTPKPSEIIRASANRLDPVRHKQIRDLLEREARAEEVLEAAGVARKVVNPGLIIPAYIFPPDSGALADKSNKLAQLNASDWRLIEAGVTELSARGIESLVIFNRIASEAKVNLEFQRQIRNISRAGGTPIGYVRLGGGDGKARWYEPLEAVRQQLEAWKGLYPDIKGFFFDTCPVDSARLTGVIEAAKIAKELFPGAMVVLNPGMTPDPGYLNSPFFDAVCSCETNRSISDVPSAPGSVVSLAAILWDHKAKPSETVSQLRAKGYRYLYITDRNDKIDVDGTPGPDDNLQWGRLPTRSVWNDLIASLKSPGSKEQNKAAVKGN